jgi:hypothetical protein
MKPDHRAVPTVLIFAHQTETALSVGFARGSRPFRVPVRVGQELDDGVGHRLAIQHDHTRHFREWRA